MSHNNRKRGSASYIVREVRSVRGERERYSEREREREIQRERERYREREREREKERYRERERERESMRERERDGSDVNIFAQKLAMSFAIFLAKNLHL